MKSCKNKNERRKETKDSGKRKQKGKNKVSE